MAQPRNHRRKSRQIFIDAGFLVALTRQRDQFHVRAGLWQSFLLDKNVRFITTEAVLWEWLDGCADVALRIHAAQGYHRFIHDQQIRLVSFDSAQKPAALALYEQCKDKDWGVTDCFSFVVMREHGLTEALTADHHFVQAGFRALLLEEPGQDPP